MLKKLFTTTLLTLSLCAPTLAELPQPLPGKDAPAINEIVHVVFETDQGPLDIEVYPEAAPNAAKRFLELVEMGFYDNTPIFRVVSKPEPFVAQFGINSEFKEWENNSFKDDPTYYQLTRGTLAFAKAGPDTNSTQVFINYRDNNRLAAPELNFTTFGQVVEGMDNADKFVSVGDERMGLDQDELWANTRLVDNLEQKPTMITSARIVKDEE